MSSKSNSRLSRSVSSKFPLRTAWLCCVVLAVFSLAARAQQATIVGTVTDSSGAAVPNVNITITSKESGAVRNFQSNGEGQYVAADLNIGHYSIRAEAPGFKVSEQKDVILQVGDRDRIDFQMQVGGTQETVTVEANPVRVQTESGEQSNVITGQQISQLARGRAQYVSAGRLGARRLKPDRQWRDECG